MALSKSNYMKYKTRLLDDFGITLTKEILDKLESLYPDEILSEQYTRRLILERLEKSK